MDVPLLLKPAFRPSNLIVNKRLEISGSGSKVPRGRINGDEKNCLYCIDGTAAIRMRRRENGDEASWRSIRGPAYEKRYTDNLARG